MNRATEEAFNALAGCSVARVDIEDDVVEFAVPQSEGWQLIVTAALDERARPALTARWEPGMRRRHRGVPLRRLLAHRPHERVHIRAGRPEPARRTCPAL